MLLHRSARQVAPAAAAALAVLTIAPVADASSSAHQTFAGSHVVASGQTWVVSHTTRLHRLTIQPGGAIAAPAGYSVTLTINGVETGQRVATTGGATTVFVPATYRGNLVLTVTKANPVSWQTLTFPFRQALYVDSSGLVRDKSVLAAVRGGGVSSTDATGVHIKSTGEAFNGLYVAGGTYALKRSSINLVGNGRSDFVGYGSAITATGGSRVVVDGARIDNTGAVRTGVVADGGANLLVKNSTIATHDGTLPAGYQSTVDLAVMEQAPWMLGIVGNVRTTNLVGDNTVASYVNSHLSSTGWGVLSSDVGQNGKLTAINSTVTATKEGYGAYAIGGVSEEFLGTTFDVATYAAINRGGTIHYGDSTASAIAALNKSRSIGLTASDLRHLPTKATVVNSGKFGVMWHGAGDVVIDGRTSFNTAQTAFLDKGQQVNLAVDGSQGAHVKAANGVIFQLMEDDDPGPQMVNGKLLNTGVYHEPTSPATRVATFDTTAVHTEDAHASFSDTLLTGNFYNAIRGNQPAGMFGPGMDGKNLDLSFDTTSITGVISSSTSKHAISTITAADYKQMGVVTNTAAAAINNGVIVSLKDRSSWNVTGKSYLTKLSIDSTSRIAAPAGKHVTMTVNGVATAIQAGHTYSGAIVISVS